MSHTLRPLLPSDNPPRGSEFEPDDPNAPRRTQSACDQCRIAKAKCSGKRPVCGRCEAVNLPCQYSTRAGESVSDALKRRNEELSIENKQIRNLLHHLQSKPESEAREILRRLRQPETNPLTLAQLLEDGDLVLQLQVNASSLDPLNPNLEFGGNLSANNDRLGRLDRALLHSSRIKVKPAVWTRIAPEGMISHLLSLFFTFDNKGNLMCIDEETFISELNKKDTSSQRYCSRFLVNAICAYQSVFSTTTSLAFNELLGGSVEERFLNEANRFLYLEGLEASCASAQGLLIMYQCCSVLGRERAGSVYRALSADMLCRLRLDDQYPVSRICSTKTEKNDRRACSRASWGLFVGHAVLSVGFQIPPAIKKPTIPRYFVMEEVNEIPETSETRGGNSPGLAQDLEELVCLDALCDIMEVLVDTCVYDATSNIPLKSPEDIAQRLQFHRRLLEACGKIPGLHFPNHVLSVSTWYVRLFYLITVIPVWRPYITLPDVDPVVDGKTPMDMFVSEGIATIEATQQHEARLGIKQYSCTMLALGYTPTFTLLFILDMDPRVPGAFTRGCQILYEMRHVPIAASLLKSLKILVECRKLSVPSQSTDYLRQFEDESSNSKGAEVDYIVPYITGDLDGPYTEPRKQGAAVTFGELIAKWEQGSFSN